MIRVDRILEIIICLINHDNVPANFLAERFHVSTRTIQRDIVSISSIGIPVYSKGGKYGGYSILPTYKMKNTVIRNDEHQMIIKALESLATSYTNDTLKAIIGKYNAIIEKDGGQKVFWDFSVTKENQLVQAMNIMIEQAITNRNCIYFDYHNAKGDKSSPVVEPLAIHYKWYAWYLFAYSIEKKEYRTYKIARIQNLHIDNKISNTVHGDIEKLMKDSEQAYYKTCIHIEVHFDEKDSGLIEEYFPDCKIEHLTEKTCRTFIDVPAKERLWKALLLSFGDKVKIVAPEDYKSELIMTAQKFSSNYDI